ASTAFNLSGTIPQKIVGAVRDLPHVAQATGVLRQQTGNFADNIVGINLEELNRMSGGFQYYEGDAAHTFTKPGELLVDDEYARQKHLHVGSVVKDIPPGNWVVCGVVAQGRLSRIFTDLPYLQDAYSVVGRINIVYIKVDASANIPLVKSELKSTFSD